MKGTVFWSHKFQQCQKDIQNVGDTLRISFVKDGSKLIELIKSFAR